MDLMADAAYVVRPLQGPYEGRASLEAGGNGDLWT